MLHLAEIHKTVTVPPPQSSGVDPLNDPFKTSVPAEYGQTTFGALPGLFYNKEKMCLVIKKFKWYKWCCLVDTSLNYRHANMKTSWLAATCSKVTIKTASIKADISFLHYLYLPFYIV